MSYSALPTSMAAVLGILATVFVLRVYLPNRWTVGLFAMTVVGSFCFLFQEHGREIGSGWTTARANVLNFVGSQVLSHPEHLWPPVVGQPYPNLQLIDQEGRRTSLSEFRGKVILLEPIGMPCEACIAFAGGHQRGAYGGIAPQKNLPSIDELAARYGFVDLDQKDIVVVQVLFYNLSLTAPTPAEVRDWALHFGLRRSANRIVLAAEPYLLSPETRAMIPGFQLLDKDGILRFDSTGHAPRHNLYTELLPNLRRLCKE